MAEPVQISARAVKIDDWILLYLNPRGNEGRFQEAGFFKRGSGRARNSRG
jgi:hypothetical protein